MGIGLAREIADEPLLSSRIAISLDLLAASLDHQGADIEQHQHSGCLGWKPIGCGDVVDQGLQREWAEARYSAPGNDEDKGKRDPAREFTICSPDHALKNKAKACLLFMKGRSRTMKEALDHHGCTTHPGRSSIKFNRQCLLRFLLLSAILASSLPQRPQNRSVDRRTGTARRLTQVREWEWTAISKTKSPAAR